MTRLAISRITVTEWPSLFEPEGMIPLCHTRDENLIRFLTAEFDALRREIELEIGELAELLR